MAQHCVPTAAVAVVSRDPTFAPQTPATSPENNVSGLLQARVSYGVMCPGRGQMSSTGADDGRPYRAYSHARHLICKCVTVRSLYVRIDR